MDLNGMRVHTRLADIQRPDMLNPVTQGLTLQASGLSPPRFAARRLSTILTFPRRCGPHYQLFVERLHVIGEDVYFKGRLFSFCRGCRQRRQTES